MHCNSMSEDIRCFQRKVNISEGDKLKLKIDCDNVWFESLNFCKRS